MNPSDLWLLERIRLGEVPASLQARAQALLEDPACREHLARLEALDAADLVAHPPAQAAQEILRRAAAQERTEAAHRRSMRRKAWGIGLPAAATLCLAIAFFPNRQVLETPSLPVAEGPGSATSTAPAVAAGSSSPTSLPTEGADPRIPSAIETPLAQAEPLPAPEVAQLPSGVRAKGESVTLVVHRRDQAKARRLFEGDTIRPGETLQLSVQASQSAHVWILSRDATGDVTVHLPESGTRSSAIDTGLHALPHAWELDGTVGFERFWIVSSATPFPTADLEKAARALPREATVLPLPGGLSQRTFRLTKVPR